MKHQRQGFWSTKSKRSQADQLKYDNEETNITPTTRIKQEGVYYKILYMKEKSTITIMEKVLCNQVEDTDISWKWQR